jgi:hypothetical protein
MSALLGPDGRPIEEAQEVAVRVPVIWLGETEGIASATHPTSGAKIGPFRILIANHTTHIPPEHKLPYEPTPDELAQLQLLDAFPPPPPR